MPLVQIYIECGDLLVRSPWGRLSIKAYVSLNHAGVRQVRVNYRASERKSERINEKSGERKSGRSCDGGSGDRMEREERSKTEKTKIYSFSRLVKFY